MLTESSSADMKEHVCTACDYSTTKLSNWVKHLSTQKHRQLTCESIVAPPSISPPLLACEGCGREYRHHSSLSRHKRSCTKLAAGERASRTAPRDDKDELAELRAKAALYDQQCESVKELKALAEKVAQRPVVSNTTNNLNINVILERECSGALNITDFVNGLRLTLQDLAYTQQNGYAKGVSNVFIQALQGLQPAVRPIHCADKQGRKLYIKDADTWGEDRDGRLLETQIGAVTKKQIEALKAWEEEHQGWRKTEAGTQAYMDLVKRVTGESSDAGRQKNRALIQTAIAQKCAIGDLTALPSRA